MTRTLELECCGRCGFGLPLGVQDCPACGFRPPPPSRGGLLGRLLDRGESEPEPDPDCLARQAAQLAEEAGGARRRLAALAELRERIAERSERGAVSAPLETAREGLQRVEAQLQGLVSRAQAGLAGVEIELERNAALMDLQVAEATSLRSAVEALNGHLPEAEAAFEIPGRVRRASENTAFLPDRRRLVVATDAALVVYELFSRTLSEHPHGLAPDVGPRGVAAATGMPRLAVADSEDVLVFDTESWALLWHVRSPAMVSASRNVTNTALALSADGRYVATGRSNGAVVVWTVGEEEPLAAARLSGDQADGERSDGPGIQSLAFVRGGPDLWVAGDGLIGCFRPTDGSLRSQPDARREHPFVRQIAVDAEGQLVASAGRGALWFWSDGDGHRLEVDSANLQLQARDRWVLRFGAGELALHERSRGTVVGELRSGVNGVRLSPDARWLLGEAGGQARLFDLQQAGFGWLATRALRRAGIALLHGGEAARSPAADSPEGRNFLLGARALATDALASGTFALNRQCTALGECSRRGVGLEGLDEAARRVVRDAMALGHVAQRLPRGTLSEGLVTQLRGLPATLVLRLAVGLLHRLDHHLDPQARRARGEEIKAAEAQAGALRQLLADVEARLPETPGLAGAKAMVARVDADLPETLDMLWARAAGAVVGEMNPLESDAAVAALHRRRETLQEATESLTAIAAVEVLEGDALELPSTSTLAARRRLIEEVGGAFDRFEADADALEDLRALLD